MQKCLGLSFNYYFVEKIIRICNISINYRFIQLNVMFKRKAYCTYCTSTEHMKQYTNMMYISSDLVYVLVDIDSVIYRISSAAIILSNTISLYGYMYIHYYLPSPRECTYTVSVHSMYEVCKSMSF